MALELGELTAAAAAAAIRRGDVTAEALVRACLGRIDTLEPQIGAWRFLDPDYAIEQAQRADELRRSGYPVGPLLGVPIGVKDIFDTADMPTEYGTPIHEGRRPAEDAAVVTLLRRAGAVILGKTVTTEYATLTPAGTRNPHDAERTPGGSSSGSAAAVAADMIPLAVGSQTAGSVIRPAAFCGVCGYKPGFGLISRAGMLQLSPSLDHVGVFARSVEDLALLGEALMEYDVRDPAMRPTARADLLATAMSEPPVAPRLAFVRQPAWGEADSETHDAFAALIDLLGEQVVEMELSPLFDDAVERHRVILDTELAHHLDDDYTRAAGGMSERLRSQIERGREVRATSYVAARAQRPRLLVALGEMFHWCDVILTPAAPGVAPLGLNSTGDPVFCSIWTLCGVPAVTLPLLKGASGMPMGVQLVGRPGGDGRLLRTARWLSRRVEEIG